VRLLDLSVFSGKTPGCFQVLVASIWSSTVFERTLVSKTASDLSGAEAHGAVFVVLIHFLGVLLLRNVKSTVCYVFGQISIP